MRSLLGEKLYWVKHKWRTESAHCTLNWFRSCFHSAVPPSVGEGEICFPALQNGKALAQCDAKVDACMVSTLQILNLNGLSFTRPDWLHPGLMACFRKHRAWQCGPEASGRMLSTCLIACSSTKGTEKLWVGDALWSEIYWGYYRGGVGLVKPLPSACGVTNVPWGRAVSERRSQAALCGCWCVCSCAERSAESVAF